MYINTCACRRLTVYESFFFSRLSFSLLTSGFSLSLSLEVNSREKKKKHKMNSFPFLSHKNSQTLFFSFFSSIFRVSRQSCLCLMFLFSFRWKVFHALDVLKSIKRHFMAHKSINYYEMLCVLLCMPLLFTIFLYFSLFCDFFLWVKFPHSPHSLAHSLSLKKYELFHSIQITLLYNSILFYFLYIFFILYVFSCSGL